MINGSEKLSKIYCHFLRDLKIISILVECVKLLKFEWYDIDIPC